MLVYLAGPLFSDAERTFNETLTEKLEAAGFDVFLPQRDGVERHRPPHDAMSPDDRRRRTDARGPTVDRAFGVSGIRF